LDEHERLSLDKQGGFGFAYTFSVILLLFNGIFHHNFKSKNDSFRGLLFCPAGTKIIKILWPPSEKFFQPNITLWLMMYVAQTKGREQQMRGAGTVILSKMVASIFYPLMLAQFREWKASMLVVEFLHSLWCYLLLLNINLIVFALKESKNLETREKTERTKQVESLSRSWFFGLIISCLYWFLKDNIIFILGMKFEMFLSLTDVPKFSYYSQIVDMLVVYLLDGSKISPLRSLCLCLFHFCLLVPPTHWFLIIELMLMWLSVIFITTLHVDNNLIYQATISDPLQSKNLAHMKWFVLEMALTIGKFIGPILFSLIAGPREQYYLSSFVVLFLGLLFSSVSTGCYLFAIKNC